MLKRSFWPGNGNAKHQFAGGNATGTPTCLYGNIRNSTNFSINTLIPFLRLIHKIVFDYLRNQFSTGFSWRFANHLCDGRFQLLKRMFWVFALS